jgi:hypothetical protein
MNGIDPYQYMQQISANLAQLDNVEGLNKALDELEYLFEVIPPEMQDQANQLMDIIRDRLKGLT